MTSSSAHRATHVESPTINDGEGKYTQGIGEVFDLTVPWITVIPIRHVSCLLCGQRNTTALNTFVFNGHRFFTVRCRADGMMWLDPQPTEDFYSQLYDQHYHIADGQDPPLEQATLDVHSNQEGLRGAAALRLDEIERFAPRGKFLEVGFGSGHHVISVRVDDKRRGAGPSRQG